MSWLVVGSGLRQLLLSFVDYYKEINKSLLDLK